jgi:hypothetical protein
VWLIGCREQDTAPRAHRNTYLYVPIPIAHCYDSLCGHLGEVTSETTKGPMVYESMVTF